MSSDYKLIGTNNYIPTGLCYHSKSGKTIEGTKQGILASKKDLTDMEKEINEFDDINNIIHNLNIKIKELEERKIKIRLNLSGFYECNDNIDTI